MKRFEEIASEIVRKAIEKAETMNEAKTVDWYAMEMACEEAEKMGLNRQAMHEFETEIWRYMPED